MKNKHRNRRIVLLRKLLFTETDENHGLTKAEIIEKMRNEYDYEDDLEWRALANDIQTLSLTGFEVLESSGKQGRKYFCHSDKLFEQYELRLLINALLSARFTTSQDSSELIQKIKQLTSKHIAAKLPDPSQFDNAVKGTYQKLKYELDVLQEAINEQKQIQFKYGKYNIDKQFVLNHDGKIYKLKPYSLIWRNDYYYLIGKTHDGEEFRHYRIDRMREVYVCEEHFSKDAINITTYVNQSFNMYTGEEAWMTIQFNLSLLNVMIDYFGLDVDMKQVSDKYGQLRAKVNLSEGLKRWILTWGADVKVLQPPHLLAEIEREIIKMNVLYHD